MPSLLKPIPAAAPYALGIRVISTRANNYPQLSGELPFLALISTTLLFTSLPDRQPSGAAAEPICSIWLVELEVDKARRGS
jgi:hypothetical protein